MRDKDFGLVPRSIKWAVSARARWWANLYTLWANLRIIGIIQDGPSIGFTFKNSRNEQKQTPSYFILV